jgi:ferredoxin
MVFYNFCQNPAGYHFKFWVKHNVYQLHRNFIDKLSNIIYYHFDIYRTDKLKFSYGIPLIVRDFIKKIQKANYIFAVVNYGNGPRIALTQTRDILKLQGLKLSAGFKIQMPQNYIPLYDAPPLDAQEKMFRKKVRVIKKIAATIEECKDIRLEKTVFPVNLFQWGVYKTVSAGFPSSGNQFWTDDNCNGCGICYKVCPVNNIEINERRPQWQNKCERCLACLQWCPNASISMVRKLY